MTMSVRLFFGYPLTSDIRMHIKQSFAWKEAQITNQPHLRDLQEIHFQDKDYIGRYIPDEEYTLESLRTLETSIHQSLLHYCPELSLDSSHAYIFPQIFIS